MRISEARETVVVVYDLKGTLCNKCGKVFEAYDDSVKQFDLPMGYEIFKFDLCYDCIMDIIKTFKIVPTGFKSDPSYTSSYDLDHELHQELFETWKISNEWPDDKDENPYWEEYESLEVGPCETEDYASVILTLVKNN